MASLQPALLLLSLWAAHSLQWLVGTIFQPASALLGRLVGLLARRRREQLLKAEEAASRASADKTAVQFVEERGGLYAGLQRHGNVGGCGRWAGLIRI